MHSYTDQTSGAQVEENRKRKEKKHRNREKEMNSTNLTERTYYSPFILCLKPLDSSLRVVSETHR